MKRNILTSKGSLNAIIISLLCLISIAILEDIAPAGLDRDGRFGHVVAVYLFENIRDSGPRDFDGTLYEEASIVRGGYGRCLRLKEDGYFYVEEDQPLSIVGGEFSIVAWVYLAQQSDAVILQMGGINSEELLYVGSVELLILPSGNIKGSHFDFENDSKETIQSYNRNIANEEWHHIAFTKYANTYSLFINGERVSKRYSTQYLGFTGDDITDIYIGGTEDMNIRRSVYLEEVGFFETGFSVYEIKGLYNNRISNFLEAMPVDPREKATTTWAEIKRR